jgi:L-fucose mutarotase
MLKTPLLHPEILRALARSGHGSQVLVADGNFASASRVGPNASLVFLNLTADIPKTTEVLAVLVESVPIQSATLMQPAKGMLAPVQDELRRLLPPDATAQGLERQAFYDAVGSPLTTLVIATGDTRRFANILLTIGVVRLEADDND